MWAMRTPTLSTIRQTMAACNNIGVKFRGAESFISRKRSAAFGRPDGALVFTHYKFARHPQENESR